MSVCVCVLLGIKHRTSFVFCFKSVGHYSYCHHLAEPRVSCMPGSHSANEPHPQIVTFNMVYIVCIDICGQKTACGASFRPPPHGSRDQIQAVKL